MTEKLAPLALSLDEALRHLPRGAFAPEEFAAFSQSNLPLPLGRGQVMLQPETAIALLEAAQIAPGERVLLIGAGTGYLSALLGALVGGEGHVVAFERLPELASAAEGNLERFGLIQSGIVEVRTGDGTKGYPAGAPYGAIIACGTLPDPSSVSRLRGELASGGRLVYPEGADLVVEKEGETLRLPGFSFAPLQE
jgi:protein-L-isoaspartate(D-aspartate) O-methyltransferase